MNRSNYAIDLDGAGDYLSGSTKPDYNADFTIMCWVYGDQKTSEANVLWGGVDAGASLTGNNVFWCGFDTNRKIQILRKAGGTITDQIVSDTAYNDSTWHCIAVTWDYSERETSNGLNLYVDGVDVGVTYTANATASDTISVGTFYFGDAKIDAGSAVGKEFDGKMTNISVWSAVLTAPQIQLYTYKKLIGSETSLDRYWAVVEGTGTTVANQTGTTENLTLNGNALWVDGAPLSGVGQVRVS